jgi:chromosome segregation ATPase
LDAVRDREKLNTEVTALTERRTLLLEELARKEAELAFAREQTAKLSATISRVSGELTRIQSGMAADAAPAPAVPAP